MIAASHIVAGAAIGSVCPRARVAVPMAFISHFVLDQIPHSCFNSLPATAWTGLPGLLTRAGLLLDAIVILLVVALSWQSLKRWVMLAAVVAAFAPDSLSYISPVSTWFALLPGSSAVGWIHRTYHCDVSRTNTALGFATQAVVIGIGLFIILGVSRTHASKESTCRG